VDARVGSVANVAKFSALSPGCLFATGGSSFRVGLVPIGWQSKPAHDRNAVPITTRVYPRRMMI